MADVDLLDSLKLARATGVLTVHHGDTTTTYRSLSELDQIIRSLEAQLLPGVRPKRNRIKYIYQLTKGL